MKSDKAEVVSLNFLAGVYQVLLNVLGTLETGEDPPDLVIIQTIE